MGHYSKRLKRDFQDDDLLLHAEVVEVISANSGGIAVPRRQVGDLVDQGKLHPEPLEPGRLNLYPYREVKSLTYKRGAGRMKHKEPTPNAIRQRRYRERHKKPPEEPELKAG